MLIKERKLEQPPSYIVATHGPALVAAVMKDPSILNEVGTYRVNCSHLGKEKDPEALAKYLKLVSKYCPVLIDLQ